MDVTANDADFLELTHELQTKQISTPSDIMTLGSTENGKIGEDNETR